VFPDLNAPRRPCHRRVSDHAGSGVSKIGAVWQRRETRCETRRDDGPGFRGFESLNVFYQEETVSYRVKLKGSQE
jgi:hypothetical protein